MSTSRYILIGGFLGAGKTSAILCLADELRRRSLSAAVVTNDQSDHLADTARVRAAKLPVLEVTGGCFCCRFDDLVTASHRLARSNHPDVMLAEPVGSCTDLQATVGHPLRRYESTDFDLAPYSVLVDPGLCSLVLQNKGAFTDNVAYIYRKQLEEADAIVINKIDLLSEAQRTDLRAALQRSFPQAKVHEISCLTGEGIAAWLDALLTQSPTIHPTMEVDYDRYADGEARLGWLNFSADAQWDHAIDADAFALELAGEIQAMARQIAAPIAHLKVAITSPTQTGLASVNLTDSSDAVCVTASMRATINAGALLINLRAEQDPEALRAGVLDVLSRKTNLRLIQQNLAAFRPGRPVPTHRLAVV